jgi:hypothetical protein
MTLCRVLTSRKRGRSGIVAVHAVDALDGDQDALVVAADFGQHGVQGLPIVVRERAALGVGMDRALDDAVVSQFVVQDQIAGAEQVPDGGLVGCVAADEHHGVFRPDEAGDSRSSRPWMVFSPDTTRLAEAPGTVLVDGVDHGLLDLGIARQAQVVVAGEVDHLASADHGGVGRDALVDVEERVLDAQHGDLAQLPPVFGIRATR